MAEPSPSLPGAERIRAIQDKDGMYKAFDSYPWAKDKTFMSGLYAILGDPKSENPRGIPSELALHARIFYYVRRVGVNIDFGDYKDWLAGNPSHTPPDLIPQEYQTAATQTQPGAQGSDGSLPAWQASAPAAELYVEKKEHGISGNTGETTGPEPAYPMAFAEMLQRIQQGLPIPGIKEIPETVVRDPSIKPYGSRRVPKKPWEKADANLKSPDSSQPTSETSFPPID